MEDDFDLETELRRDALGETRVVEFWMEDDTHCCRDVLCPGFIGEGFDRDSAFASLMLQLT